MEEELKPIKKKKQIPPKFYSKFTTFKNKSLDHSYQKFFKMDCSHLGIFDVPIFFSFGIENKKLLPLMLKYMDVPAITCAEYFAKYDSNTLAGRCTDFAKFGTENKEVILVNICDSSPTYDTIVTIAHEFIHCASRILERRNTKLLNKEEALCTLHSFLFEEVLFYTQQKVESMYRNPIDITWINTITYN